MRKFHAIAIMSLLVFPMGCFSYKIVKDDVKASGKYYNTMARSDILDFNSYNQFVAYARQLIVESGNISAEHKKKLANFVDNLRYDDNKFIYFTLETTMPFLDNEIDLSFKLRDARKNNLLQSITLIPIKHMLISSYGTSVGYTYTWVIQCTKPLVKEFISEEKQPVEFMVRFPDESTKVYNIKL
ncbi:MAG TPA: hypothetical protein P5295_11060 [Spirochaetota bacterium]|nr:hypothetical protein [Spirochaetota bacterium]